MAIKSADQITIMDITDAYSIMLSNEAHTFPGGTATADASSTTTTVSAWCGGTQVGVTIGNIVCPTGVTATSDNNATTPTITISLANTVTSGGVVKIPVTITGKNVTIVKEFTYGIAFTGKGISKVETYYLTTSSGSGVTTNTSGWNTTPTATTTTNKYIWSYQKTTYTDGTSTSSTPAIVGTHGASGINGTNGAAGKGISKVETFYLTTNSSSGVTTSTSGWSTTPTATTTSKKYIWSYQKFTYTDNTTSSSTPAIVGTHGATGAAGADAITLSITTNNGNVFKNSTGTTTLTAEVYSGGTKLTDTQIEALGTIKWYKNGGSTAVGTGTTHTVSASDVTDKATYTAKLEDGN